MSVNEQPAQQARPLVPIVASVVWGVLFFPGLFGAAMSAMFFDAPGSESNPYAWINAGIVTSFPLLCLLSIALGWLLWAVQRRRAATRRRSQIVVACLPMLPIAYLVAVIVVGLVELMTSGAPPGLHSTTYPTPSTH